MRKLNNKWLDAILYFGALWFGFCMFAAGWSNFQPSVGGRDLMSPIIWLLVCIGIFALYSLYSFGASKGKVVFYLMLLAFGFCLAGMAFILVHGVKNTGEESRVEVGVCLLIMMVGAICGVVHFLLLARQARRNASSKEPKPEKN